MKGNIYSAKAIASLIILDIHNLPICGEKESSYGMGSIPFTYRDMQVEKMAVIRSPALKF